MYGSQRQRLLLVAMSLLVAAGTGGVAAAAGIIHAPQFTVTEVDGAGRVHYEAR
jgi:hypothetical protein